LLLRQAGEAGLQPSSTEAAETSFQQALAIARRQQAKSWELRAATSLGRLWQQQGKRDEARELLAPIYGWFTEGFDTADLREAKALLEELGG
jgi:predicted ATPase